ncbi:MAG TPA: phosphoenolpyruvate--protein phosphotransferase [Acidimicrobiia bacterium]|nr:phosphoenolpyruvate--protein phosphotransferase [Acidimicrobiia bacterium]
MVGIVVVSHSRRLAEAAVALALEMVHGQPPPIAIAAGLDPDTLGTDAMAVKAAIESLDSPEGVVVLMDLGSAVLSTELALDLIDPGLAERVVLTPAPLVEGLVAAVVQAASGAGAVEVAADAMGGLLGKQSHLGSQVTTEPAPQFPPLSDVTALIDIDLVHGLHARPAARLVSEARRFDASLSVRNLSTGAGPVPAGSLSRVASLGAVRGHRLEITASGRQAKEAVEALLALAARNFDEAESAPAAAAALVGAGPLPASPGIAVGPVVKLGGGSVVIPEANGTDPTREWRRLREALAAVRGEIGRARARIAREAGEHEAAIFDAHLMLLDDEEVIEPTRLAIEAGRSAPRAWNEAIEAVASQWSAIDDPYLNGRAADVQGVGEQVLRHIVGAPARSFSGSGVLVADDLTPADTAKLDPEQVVGIVTAYGSPSSHSAILARSLGIPAVVAAGRQVLEVPAGTVVAVDGTAGVVLVDPAEEVREEYKRRRRQLDQERKAALARSHLPVTTGDGMQILVEANVGSMADAELAARVGADGVGLLRTEFLFMGRNQAPSVDEQEKVYGEIASVLGGSRLTIRTLDVGGDKPLGYLAQAAEANPYLGLRGLRLGLRQPGLLLDQLEAVCRVAHFHPVSVMFPMVATVAEVEAARSLLDEAGERVGGIPEALEVGIMVEIPAAALNADALAPLVDFFSIGTNDLTQYTLAAERGNEAVAALADGLDPAVLRLIDLVSQAAAPAGVRVAVCGELAADSQAVPILVGLGVEELSVSAPLVPEVKDRVRGLHGYRELAARALRAGTAAAVRRLTPLPEAGRAGEARAGDNSTFSTVT